MWHMAKVSRHVTVEKDHDTYIEEHIDNFSEFVRTKIDEERGEDSAKL